MRIFLLPHPDKTRDEDPPYVYTLADDDWAALAEILAADEPDEPVSVHVVVPFHETDPALMEFPSEASETNEDDDSEP